MKKLSLLIFFIFCTQNLKGQSISVTGDWNYTVPSTDITEAGEDFTGIYESNVNQVSIDIQYNNKWEVSINKNDIDWINDFKLSMRRTGEGLGSKKLKGGKNYKEIKNGVAKFFSGDKDRFFIPIQFKIENVSVTIPVNTYIVEIVYTVKAN